RSPLCCSSSQASRPKSRSGAPALSTATDGSSIIQSFISVPKSIRESLHHASNSYRATCAGRSRMAMRVRKAVFPAAGLGTRFLPATKAQPKEMLPIVDKPIIQYGVEEALASGCDQIIIITGRGKTAIEDHFDVSYELEKMLEERGKIDLLAIVHQISDMIHVAYVRQKEALGLGHAVLTARELIGDEPFATLLADDVIDAKVPVLKQLMNVFDEKHCSVIATQIVDGPAISS